jgi:transcriptional regulator GlxA family with amidase domain
VGYHYHTHFTKAYKRKYKRFPSDVRGKEVEFKKNTNS